MDPSFDQKLADIALREGLITSEQLSECLQRQKTSETQRPLHELLLESNYINGDSLKNLFRLCEEEDQWTDQIRSENGKGAAEQKGSDPAEPPVREAPYKATAMRRPTRFRAAQEQRFGKYKLLRELGSGAMGVVWLATDEHLHRKVALKMLRETEAGDPETVSRFLREAKTTARLNHESIVTIHEVGSLGGTPFFTMEFIEGETLHELLEQERISRAEALRVLKVVSRAIHYAHGEGVVHRDLKPRNIIVDVHGQPHLTDFGLAKCEAAGGPSTEDGTAVGTPHFMAPEQVRGEIDTIGPRTDIYALGVMLYRVLTGKLPYEGRSVMELYQRILTFEPRRPRQIDAGIPAELETVCTRAMAKEATLRYESAAQFADDVQRYLDGRPIAAKPISVMARLGLAARRNVLLVGMSCVAVAALAVVGVLLFRYLESTRATQNQKEAAERRVEAGTHFARAQESWESVMRPGVTPETARKKLGEADVAIAGAIAVDPTWMEAYRLRARVAALQGNLDQSLENWDRAVELDPSERLSRGRCRLQRYALFGAVPAALSGVEGEVVGLARAPAEWVEAELSHAAEDFGSALGAPEEGAARDRSRRLCCEAVVALAQGRDAEAIQKAGLLRSNDEESYETALLVRSIASRRTGAWRQMYEDLRRLADLRPRWVTYGTMLPLCSFSRDEMEWAIGATSGRPEAAMLRGTLQEALRRPQEAEEEYSKTGLGEGSETAEALARRAMVRLSVGRVQEAQKDADRACELEPALPEALLARGTVRFRSQNPAEALKDAGAVLQLRGQDAGAMLLEGEVRLVLQEAARTLHPRATEIASLVPSHASYTHLASVRYELRDFLGAQENAKEALRILPTFPPALVVLAMSSEGRGQYEQALEYWTDAFQHLGTPRPALLCRRGDVYRRLKRWEEALQDFDRALGLESGNREALLGRAKALYEQGERERSVDEFERFLQRFPDDYRELTRRAEAYVELGEFRLAMQDFTDALGLEPPKDEQVRISHRMKSVEGEWRRSILSSPWYQAFEAAGSEINAVNQNPSPKNYQEHYPRAKELYLKGLSFLEDPEALTDMERNALCIAFYNLACIHAVETRWTDDEAERTGLIEQAVHRLQQTVEHGFLTLKDSCHRSQREHLQTDPDMEAIRQHPYYLELMKKGD